MALGEQFYEHKGKVIGQRVLDVDGEEGPKIETTFSAEAKIKGTIEVNEVGTYASIINQGGILHGQGYGLYTAKDESGEMATWTGYGIGRFVGSGRVSYRGSLFYKTKGSAGGKLSFLNNLVGVFEHEVDQLGNTTGKVWEWK
jgi:hypothetical protein